MKNNVRIKDFDKLSYEDKEKILMKLAKITTVDEEINDLVYKINEKCAEIKVREEMASRMIDEGYSDKEISYITRISLNDVEILRKRK